MNLIERLLEANERSRRHLTELEETAVLLGKSVDRDPGLHGLDRPKDDYR